MTISLECVVATTGKNVPLCECGDDSDTHDELMGALAYVRMIYFV